MLCFISKSINLSQYCLKTLGKLYEGNNPISACRKANISRSHLSTNEAAGMVRAFSLEVFFNIADALDVDSGELINASMFPEKTE